MCVYVCVCIFKYNIKFTFKYNIDALVCWLNKTAYCNRRNIGVISVLHVYLLCMNMSLINTCTHAHEHIL